MITSQDYLKLQKKQLQLEVEAIRLLMQHGSAKGTEAERVLRKLLRKHLPQKYSIGSGFVTQDGKLSPQTDIIIYDNILNVPVYEGAANGVYRAGSVYACIEVTMGILKREKLETDIKKLGKHRAMLKKLVSFKKVSAQPHPSVRGFVGVEESFRAIPLPLAYICALSGTTYAKPESLASDIKRFATKYGAHTHGVLVIDRTGQITRKKNGCFG